MDRFWPLLAAPFVGSFLGVLIRRLPAGRGVLVARSACDGCGGELRPWELVPLLSYAAQRGRCRRCAGSIDPFHWHVELASVLVACCAVAAGLAGAALWAACAAGWLLLALAWIDAETMLLPDALTFTLLAAGLAAAAWLDRAALVDRAAAAALGYSLLAGVGLLYRVLRRREGLGGGDPKLLAALGAWVGLAGLPMVLLGAALAGLCWAAWLRVRGEAVGMATALPFGPFLALSGWVVLLQGG